MCYKIFRIAIVSGLCLILFAIGTILVVHFSHRNLEETKSNANIIISALESYADQNGEYPERLDDLTPIQIDQIPPCTWGCKEWAYNIERDGSYVLSFAAKSELPAYIYSSKSGNWLLDDG